MSTLTAPAKRIDPSDWKGRRFWLRQRRNELIEGITKIGKELEAWIGARDAWKMDPLTEEAVYTYIPLNASRTPKDPIEVAIEAFNGDRLSFVINPGDAVLRVRANGFAESIYSDAGEIPGRPGQDVQLWRHENGSKVGSSLSSLLADWEQSVFQRTTLPEVKA